MKMIRLFILQLHKLLLTKTQPSVFRIAVVVAAAGIVVVPEPDDRDEEESESGLAAAEVLPVAVEAFEHIPLSVSDPTAVAVAVVGA